MAVGNGGDILNPWGTAVQMLAQMSNYNDSYPMSISTLSAYVTGGYLDMNAWKPGERVYSIHNAGSAEATVIYQNGAGTDVTLKLAQNQFTGKLPKIRYIKQSGTSDSLVVFTQMYKA